MEIRITAPQLTCIRCKATATALPREIRRVRGIATEDGEPLWQVTASDPPPGWKSDVPLCPNCVASWLPPPAVEAASLPAPAAQPSEEPVAPVGRFRASIPAIVKPANTPIRLQGPEQNTRVAATPLPPQPHVIAPQALQPAITPERVRQPVAPAGARVLEEKASEAAPRVAPSSVRTSTSQIANVPAGPKVEVQKRPQSIVVTPAATPIPHDAPPEIPSAQRTSFPDPIVKPR